MTEPKHCDLHYALGRLEPCPYERCGLWEGGPRPRGGCAVEGVEEIHEPTVARWLLQLRARLEDVR